jgi:DNA-binding transcriptional ArsR family regulator
MSSRTETTTDRQSAEICCGTPDEAELATLARGLGHPLRVTILRTLLEVGDCLCGDLVAAIPRAQSTVSQHLKILKETGLVKGEVDGPRVCYCANRQAVTRFRELLNTFETDPKPGGCQ